MVEYLRQLTDAANERLKLMHRGNGTRLALLSEGSGC